MNSLKRFWFEFVHNESIPMELIQGCGVTAFDREDGIRLIKDKFLIKIDKLNISKVIENVDISKLDQNHVVPNMAPPNSRGIWFPLGYQ